MITRLKRKLQQLIASQIDPFRDEVFAQVDGLKFSMGQLHASVQRSLSIHRLQDAEFKVFSQNGEDGIIQHLISHVPITNKSFIEIGVQNYCEANTRFLMMSNNWQGMIVDADENHVRFLEESGLRWRHRIVPITAFVTRENVNSLIEAAGYKGDVGLLSVDIDGMDYWVLQAVKVVSPRILVVEYNSRFGNHRAVTVPYDDRFNRTKAHYSNCYFGASLAAFCMFAEERGYAFVGSGSSGVNAFFVRRDVLPESIRPLTIQEGFTNARLQESRNPDGTLAYLTNAAERELMGDLPVVDLASNQTVALKSIFEIGGAL